MRIGISKASGSPKYQNYSRWLLEAHPELEVVDLSASADPEEDILHIHALVLTGGPDVDPARYDRGDASDVCIIDAARDGLEFRLVERTLERRIPILGICRGAQLLNVYFGGTLIPDIPARYQGNLRHSKIGDEDNIHDITIEPGSLLYKIAGDEEGTVNSAHHQAIDGVGEGLAVTARAGDGIVEAIEWSDTMGKAYLLGIQWHPERMKDADNPLTRNIREQFLFEVESSQIANR